MRERVAAFELLRAAAVLYDDPRMHLSRAARAVRLVGGFAAGGRWMRLAMSAARGGHPIPRRQCDFARLGILKYAAALLAAGVCGAAVATLAPRLALLVGLLSFYAAECQMVFLFPLAIDGSTRPLGDSRAMTARAGGTLEVLRVVLPLAGFMLFGGFAGKGFVRAWCLGCLAVVLWYERVGVAPCAAATAEVA